MQTRAKSRASLFLLELLIVILFFALAAGVCVNLFAQAHIAARQGTELTQATLQAQSAAECVQAACGDQTQAARLLGAARAQDGTLCVLFDANWQPTRDAHAGAYTLQVRCETVQGLQQTRIEICRADGAQIYQLQLAQYVGGAVQ
nr:hypothetical protein [Maliibacterium massiliense]